MFVTELIKVFNVSRSQVSLIPSILVGVTLSIGPIASSLTNRYGCRLVTIVGAVIAAIGLAASAFTPSVTFLYLSIGLCTGTQDSDKQVRKTLISMVFYSGKFN